MKSYRLNDKRSGLITALDFTRPIVRISYWLVFAILVVGIVISVVPIIYAFLAGFKTVKEYMSSTPKFFPESITFERFKGIFTDFQFMRSFKNTMIMFVCTWIGNVIVCGIAGYTISRLRPKGSALLFKLMLWTMMMPTTVNMIPNYKTWSDFPYIHWNFMNTWIPFLVGGFSNVFNILLFKNFFDHIPDSYIEAARLDGASNLRIFSKIVMPLSTPIIATVTISSFNGAMSNFVGPLLYFKDYQMQPLAVRLYQFSQNKPGPDVMLASFLLIIPNMIVFILCARKILNTGAASGVKG